MCKFCEKLKLFTRRETACETLNEHTFEWKVLRTKLISQTMRRVTFSEPFVFSETSYGEFNLNFCPECGRKIYKEVNKNAENS